MAINFKHTSMNVDDILKTTVPTQNREPVDKTAFYKAPTGLTQFRTPTQNVTVTMDVLEFVLTNKIHKYFLDKSCWDASGKSFWYYPMKMHECFPKSIPCSKNWSLKRENNDVCCSKMWETKEAGHPIDHKRVNKTYAVMLLRVHPNKKLGIEDYQFMYHIDTLGKFTNTVNEAWEKVINKVRNTMADGDTVKQSEMKKLNFFKWSEEGCSLEVTFGKIKSPMGLEFWGASDVEFIPREKQLDQGEVDFLEGLDMCAGITPPTDEETESFMKYFKRKAPNADGTFGYEGGEEVEGSEKIQENLDGAVQGDAGAEEALEKAHVEVEVKCNGTAKDSVFAETPKELQEEPKEEPKEDDDEDFWK